MRRNRQPSRRFSAKEVYGLGNLRFQVVNSITPWILLPPAGRGRYPIRATFRYGGSRGYRSIQSMRGDLGYSWLVCGQLPSENDRDPLRKHENESPTGSPSEVASPEATPGEQPDPAYQPSAYNRLIFMENGNRGRAAGFHQSNWWPARPHRRFGLPSCIIPG